MKLHLFDIPDDHRKLPAWLEKQLVGVHLAELVAELTAVHGSSERPTIEDLLDGQWDAVYQSGISGLSQATLRRLLTQPALLLDLQDLVLINGGDYWNQVEREAAVSRMIDRGRRNVLNGPDGNAAAAQRYTAASQRRRDWLVALGAIAATTLVILASQQSRRTPTQVGPVAWGWNKPGAIPAAGSRSEYLEALANAANDWFSKRPAQPADLATRILQFRQGCSTLILSEHKPLSADDRSWLVGKCRAWAEKLDQHLEELESGADALVVLDAADETIRKLTEALRERARIPQA